MKVFDIRFGGAGVHAVHALTAARSESEIRRALALRGYSAGVSVVEMPVLTIDELPPALAIPQLCAPGRVSQTVQ